ncbi:hypothetical protein MG293_005368 [Ovis ammon polii]|uniref:RNA polymerase II subunit A C-terminal domain phosphatase SSU72 n=1 Tax=Ovis ammon polii TaxID=230172 RepID=A0AAD4UEN6_OVIAM|nr:hypothetical protein MG293_005368 [Ovis ammon polii]
MSGKVTKPKEEKDASKGIRVKRESDFRVVRLFCLPSRGPESFPNVTAELFSTVIDNDLNIISFTSKPQLPIRKTKWLNCPSVLIGYDYASPLLFPASNVPFASSTSSFISISSIFLITSLMHIMHVLPERFQDCKDPFDLIPTCEKQVYDQVVEDMSTREQETCQPVHVINVNNLETHKEATLGAFIICDLCQCVQLMEGLEDRIGELLQVFEEKSGRSFLHTVCFYLAQPDIRPTAHLKLFS